MTIDYISVAEFSSRFRVSTTLVYKLIKEGHIPAIRLGNRNYRISAKTVEDIEESRLFNLNE